RVEEPEEVLQRERQRDVLLAVPVEIARKISLSSESPDRSRAELAPRPCLQHEFIHESSEASSRSNRYVCIRDPSPASRRSPRRRRSARRRLERPRGNSDGRPAIGDVAPFENDGP